MTLTIFQADIDVVRVRTGDVFTGEDAVGSTCQPGANTDQLHHEHRDRRRSCHHYSGRRPVDEESGNEQCRPDHLGDVQRTEHEPADPQSEGHRHPGCRGT